MMQTQYQRVLLKLSGEALAGDKGSGFDEATIASICAGIRQAHDLGVQIGIVVGGGNFWRGRSSGKMDRMDADKIGMLATVMNALAVKDALRQQGVPAVVMTSSVMPQVAEPFTSDKAIAALEALKRPSEVILYSDSKYLVDAINEKWLDAWVFKNWKQNSKNPVKNIDLWKRLIVQVERHNITWHKVKGHADNELNNRCDALARGEIEKIRKTKEQ